MAIESLVKKKYFFTSEQSVMFCEFVDRGRQICCTESFLNCFLKYFLNINNRRRRKIHAKCIKEINFTHQEIMFTQHVLIL
jgi:hypothetical protein